MLRQILWLITALLCLTSVRGQRERCDKAPSVTGPCQDYQRMVFFHKSLNECIIFDWGGCQGTENLFATLEECESLCLDLGEVIVANLE